MLVGAYDPDGGTQCCIVNKNRREASFIQRDPGVEHERDHRQRPSLSNWEAWYRVSFALRNFEESIITNNQPRRSRAQH
jgi:hypothetical protein